MVTLGINIECIKQGHPQHERMRITLKKKTTRPPNMNNLQQQDSFDAFVQEYSYERPHEGCFSLLNSTDSQPC